MDTNFQRKGNDIIFEHEGQAFVIHTDGVKKKKLLKLAKLMKKR